MDKFGGPAFPAPYEFVSGQDRGNIMCTTGLTTWDFYAAAALTGFCAGLRAHPSDASKKLLSELAADQADAMLQERRKRESGS